MMDIGTEMNNEIRHVLELVLENGAGLPHWVEDEVKGLLRKYPEVKRHCCYLNCGKAAEWTIESGTGPDDYTDSCTQHVGELLINVPEHRIYPIESEKVIGRLSQE